MNGCHGYFEVSLDEERDALAVRVQIADPRTLYLIVERIRSMFDLNADWAAIAQSLGTDPELTSRISAEPGLHARLLGRFELTTRAILGQQIISRTQTRLRGKWQSLANVFRHNHASVSCRRSADAKLAGLGLTKKRRRRFALARGLQWTDQL